MSPLIVYENTLRRCVCYVVVLSRVLSISFVQEDVADLELENHILFICNESKKD